MNWPARKLSDFFDITSSKRVFKFQWTESGVPFYRAREVVKLAQDGSVQNELFISRAMYEDYKKKYGIPLPGDLLVTGVGTLGKVYVVKQGDEFYFKDGNIIWLKKKKEILSTYVDYVFKTKAIQEFIQNSPGATVGTYTISKANETIIPVPPLEEQKRIATILDKADNLRRKRQQAIQLADQFLRSVFLDLFGDPVTNLKEFPVGTIRDLVESVNYGSSSKASEIEGEFPILRMGNITYQGGWDFSNLKYIDLSDKDKPKYLVKKGDLLFNRTNSKELVGKTAVFETDNPMAIAGYLIRVRANEKGNTQYISGYLNSGHGKQTLVTMCKSIVGMANINAQELQDIKILIPPIELQEKYEQIVIETKKKLKNLIKSDDSLNKLFGSLSQKAFAGEL